MIARVHLGLNMRAQPEQEPEPESEHEQESEPGWIPSFPYESILIGLTPIVFLLWKTKYL